MSQGLRIRRAKPVMVLLCFITIALHAQDSRQKIGLVLEGGGALGLAHIGVLQWLYQHHVPVDFGGRHQHGRLGRWFLRDRPFS